MIKLARIFQDGMVLQRQKPIRLWGETNRKQNVAVSLDGKILYEKELPAGSFSIFLPPREAAENLTLVVSGESETLIFNNIDIGEVWIAGGQSNMEYPLRFDIEADSIVPYADDAHLRYYETGKYSFEGEEEEGFKDTRYMDKWLEFNPENAVYFSAVGMYFAAKIKASLNVPIGVVGCSWGGTTAYAWLGESYLDANPKFAPYLDEYKAALEKLDIAKYEKKGEKARRLMASELVQRMIANSLFGKSLFSDVGMRMLPALLKVIGYTLTKGPKDPNRPSGLYHTMVRKIEGYSGRGVLWYQGESDEARADIYAELFSAVIRCWRDAWRDELPFFFVQLAPFGKAGMGSGKNFPAVRRRQEWVSKHVSDCYMISSGDAGLPNDIHPKNKRPIGERLALMALGKLYGEDILCDAPELAHSSVSGGEIVLRFAYAGEGLSVKGEKLNDLKVIVGGKELKDPSAGTEGDCVKIQNPKISEKLPIEILFAWAGYSNVNLYNSAGLPAKPFKWEYAPENV
ncbi:MAG: sialate O-acetylesterase [Oscillospiraceae bacterium]|jgi:sialate O-acetylesterase|nr:sialate O-acetylesterase [Oscillospiraceae bacterium]